MGSCLTNPFISAAALLSLIVTGCSSHRSLSSGSMPGYRGGPTGVYYSNTIPTTGQRAYSGHARQGTPVSAPALVPRKAPLTLLSEVRVHKDYLPKSARGRRGQSSMRPRYITIHSTQNWSKGADPWRHSRATGRSICGGSAAAFAGGGVLGGVHGEQRLRRKLSENQLPRAPQRIV